MRKWSLIVAAVAAVFGGALAVMSTVQHLRIQREGLINQSYCAFSETINCDIVNASSYSEFLGVPIAWWGVIFYFLVLIFSLYALASKKDRSPTIAVAWFMSCAGMLYSAFLAYIATFVLGAVCIECLGMYLANILLFVFLYVALRVSFKEIFDFVGGYFMAVIGRSKDFRFKPQIIKHAVVIGIAFAVGWVGIANTLAQNDRIGEDIDVNDLVKYFYLESLHDVQVSPDWAMWGNPKAKVTIVEYSEYQCPFCRLSAFNIKAYLHEFKNDVRYLFVNFPLDTACNFELSRQMHPVACFAARAGICAQKKGDFWSFHDDMFRSQRELSENVIMGFAKKRGWNPEEFGACVESDEVKERLASEIASAKKAYVVGTPTIFMNGRKLKYWKSPEFLRKVVGEEIKRSKVKK
jgi:protein-disulfide isomerase/uncharacterized membrane protein